MQQHRPQGNGQVVTMMRTTASTQPQIIIVACCITLRRSGYDTAGNIRSITKDGTVTKSFGYTNPSWPDLLTSVTANGTTKDILYEGQTRTSDVPSSGNPITYYNGKDYTFTWTKGRQLASATVDGKQVSYTYDMSGVRTSKTVDGTTYHYTTLSGKVMRQQWGSKSLEFVYDDGNQPFAMIYKHGSAAELYYYLVNAQGDVAAILDSSGTMVASYNYDAWGSCTVYNSSDAAIGDLNPLRYRGYYYDRETRLYYLQSRYYDFANCRFINADTFATTDANGFLSANMFAYCENNPVNGYDPSGEWVHLAVGAVLGAVANMATSYSTAKKCGKSYDLLSAGIDAVSGAISGALAASGVGLAGQVIGNTAIDVTKGILDGQTSAKEIVTNAFLGGVGGLIGGKGASFGNAKSIMRSGQQFAKRVFTYKDSFRKAFSYYKKTAHVKEKKFVLNELYASITRVSIYSYFRGIHR